MWRNYLKIAFRNIVRNRTYSLVNIIGLAIGIACFILIALYIADELSYDRYHQNAKNIYRVVNTTDFGGVGEESSSCPFPVGPTLASEYPGMVKKSVRFFNFQAIQTFIEYKEKHFNEKRIFFVDSTIFDVFDVNFVSGSAQTALIEPFSIILTESTAKRYFGNENPIGKNLKIQEQINMKVTGVIKDTPLQSHLKYDFLASMSSVRTMYGGKLPETWVWNPCWTYLLLENNVNPKALESQFKNFISKYFYDAEKGHVSLYLQALTDIHLKSNIDYEIEPNSNILYIYILSAIAVFLLIIACINYMNLSTASSSLRAKEIGIKKTVGAYRSQLVSQFITEALIMSFLALFIAIILVELTLPIFNNLADKSFHLGILFEPKAILSLIIIGIVTGVIAGCYPAFFLASLEPAKIIKGGSKNNIKSGFARKALVTIQFSVSIALVIGTIIAYQQLNYMRNADLGFKKDHILLLPVYQTPIVMKYETFKSSLLQNPSIESVTSVDDIVGSGHNTHEFRPEGFPNNKWQFYPALVVKYDFVKTFGIKIIEGRDYSKDFKTDPMEGMLINEAMVKHMGWKSNKEAIGKQFKSRVGNEKVIGVINDFNSNSLHTPAGPFALNMKEEPWEIAEFTRYIAIRLSGNSNEKDIYYIQNLWNKFAPNRPFQYTFLDKELDKLYKGEEKLGKLAGIFTILIIIIASVGLIGLTSFMTEQRTKEIGIRKVLGASTQSIVQLLSKEFLKLVIVSSLIAFPASFYLLNLWLNNFAYREKISWVVFLVSGAMALVFTLLISGFRAYRASLKDPVITLKYE